MGQLDDAKVSQLELCLYLARAGVHSNCESAVFAVAIDRRFVKSRRSGQADVIELRWFVDCLHNSVSARLCQTVAHLNARFDNRLASCEINHGRYTGSSREILSQDSANLGQCLGESDAV